MDANKLLTKSVLQASADRIAGPEEAQDAASSAGCCEYMCHAIRYGDYGATENDWSTLASFQRLHEFETVLREHRVSTNGNLCMVDEDGPDLHGSEPNEGDLQAVRFMFLDFLALSGAF